MADNRQGNISETSEAVFRWHQRLRRYRLAIAAIAIFAVLVVVAELFYAHTKGAKPFDSYANLLLQLASFIFGGLILTPLIEHINKQRDKRSKRMDFLHRMRESHVRIANAQRLIYADSSPETYREQMRLLMLVTPKLEDIERDIDATTDLFCKKRGDKAEIQEGICEIVAYLDEGYDQYAEWQRNGGTTVDYKTLRERKIKWLGELIECKRYMPKRYTRALDKSKGMIRSYVYGHRSDAATSENKKLVRRFVNELVNARNLTSADELLADDLVLRLRLPPIKGREIFNKSLQYWQAAFPDWRISIKKLTAEDDKVVCHWKCEATLQRTLMGMAPTEKRVSWTANDVFRIENGRIAEITAEEDMIALMRQLGAAPEPTLAE
jgi:steroid delta-isomerase-like uncharacterized protein